MLRKIAEIKVPKGAGPREAKTKPIFATYDRQGAAFAFYFSDSNIAGAMANLLFMVDGQKVFVDDGVTLSETNETHTFTYPLPDKLLNYTGEVDGYLYLNFADGSQSDEIHFTFSIKKSQIDEEMEDAPDVYIKSFEEIKSDVKSKADQAKKDMQDNVDQVESDYQAWKEQQESKQNDIKNNIDGLEEKVDSTRKSVENLNIDTRNLLTGTSDEWEKTDDKFAGYSGTGYPAVGTDLSEGETVTYSVEIDNTIDQQNDSELFSSLRFTLNNGKIKPFEGNKIPSGEKGVSSVTCVVPSDVKVARHVEIAQRPLGTQKVGAYRKPTLNHGPLAAPWAPAPEEIVIKSEIEQIKQAIIALGGEI